MTRFPVKPELLRWASERSRKDALELSARFPNLLAWERGEKQPTIKQLEAFAKATHTPFGDFFLPEPPAETLPIADFRECNADAPSVNLLDTIYAAERRQDWAKEYATIERRDVIDWIGKFTVDEKPPEVAAYFHRLLDFDPNQRKKHPNWEAATKALFDRTQALGVLLSVNGVVGCNTRRPLDPNEFRGFSLVDPLAPLIFINGADHKAAHAFTLCHELAHQALGRPGLSNEDLGQFRHDQVEAWCDAVASEILAPLDTVRDVPGEEGVLQAAEALARELRISPLFAVRRVAEHSKLPLRTFERCFQKAVEALPTSGGGAGGNSYATTLKRVGHRFARDLVASTLEGNTTYTEAFRLLGVRNSTSFQELSRRLGFAP